MLLGNRVGDVGERRGAFVGGDHQIGIVAIVTHHVVGRHHALEVEIVGDVEQRRDEELVGCGAFGLDRLARPADGQELRHEAALGADRHDHRVLDLLRLHQTENFGAEVLRPVGPADAAARDLAEAQVHALDARRIDEDFIERLGQRQAVDLLALELDRDQRLGLAGVVELIIVGADRRLHRVDEVADDAVLVEALDVPQRGFDLGEHRRFAPLALLRRTGGARIEPGVEQIDHLGSERGVLAHRRPHVILRIGHADLPQEARNGAQQRDVAPHQAGGEREHVVAVVLGSAAHDDDEQRFERELPRLEILRAAGGAFQRHVVEPDLAAALGSDVIGALVHDPEAHVFEHGHAHRQRDRAGHSSTLRARRKSCLSET